MELDHSAQGTDKRLSDFERTVEKHKRTVYGIALTQLKNRHEADDVFQEVFLLYFRKNPQFENENAEKAWFVKTAVNKCRQFNFSIWNTRVDKTDISELALSVNIRSEREERVYCEVLSLGDKYRMPIYLHYFLGMSVEEAAKILGISANTVSVRLSRARKQLKKRLEGIDI